MATIIFEGFPDPHYSPSENLTLTTQDKYGYFPARLNQSLHGRYTILRKLGWGTASSVFLAKDNQLGSFVALKIATAFLTEKLPDHEASILRRIRDAVPDHPGRRYCPLLIDQFSVESERGKHSVLVTPVSGPSLHALTVHGPSFAKKGVIPLPVVKQWAREMLMALDYLHTHVGVIHSDFRFPNILLNAYAPEAITSVLVENPIQFHAKNDAHGPVPTFISQPLPVPQGLLNGSTPAPSIMLIDFGGANWIEKHTYPTCQHSHLRGPEVILGHPWGPPADIWAFSCIVFELLATFRLMGDPGPWAEDDVTEDDFDLQQMTFTGERFSAEFLSKCERRSEFLDEQGNLKRRVPPEHTKVMNWVERLRKFATVLSATDVDPAVDFLKRGLRLEPSARATAAQLLKDPWLKDGSSLSNSSVSPVSP